MRLTCEQKGVVEYTDGNAVVIACPGSGKTRTLIAKLAQCIEEVKGTPRKVACITYTNAAVYEIENRILRNISISADSYSVATIHSFCLNNILKNYFWRLEEYKDGFDILPNDSEENAEIVANIAQRHGLNDYDRDNSFELLGRKPNGKPILSGNVTEAAAYDYWQELTSRGYIDFSGILFYSYQILLDSPSIAKAAGAKFHYILVDEFQDTTELQTELLLEIYKNGLTNFILVGDPEQSIYSFAGAKPELLSSFSEKISAKYFSLSGNFRSSKKIIDCAERIIPREPTMYMANSENDFNEEPLIKSSEDNFEALTDYFIPSLDEMGVDYGNAAILAPSWYELYPLGKKLREYGIPIIGPGARPYKRNHLIGRIAEPISEYLCNPSVKKVNRIEKELLLLLNDMGGNLRTFKNSYESRRVVYLLVEKGREISEKYNSAKDWITQSAISFADILIWENYITENDAELFSESAEDIIKDIVKNKVDIENMSVADLGLIANPDGSIKLLTMHKSKGREFDAVAIISLNDGQIPYHNYYNPLTEERLNESRRQFYVSITRAKRFLMMFYKEGSVKPASRFLDAIDCYR